MREFGEDAGNDALKVFEDKQGAIALSKTPEFHKRTKHIDIRYHFVREKVDDDQVLLEYYPTQEMLADIVTKPVFCCAVRLSSKHDGDQDTKVCRVEWESCYEMPRQSDLEQCT